MAEKPSINGYRPPSEDESKRYLLGLGGNPRLIARTSTDRYVYEEYADEKILATLGRENPLTEKFLVLQPRIVNVLQGRSEPVLVNTHHSDNMPAAAGGAPTSIEPQFEWTAILPLRMGVRKGRYIEDPTEYPTVLIITVARSSAYSCNWANAMRMALACRAVLHRAHSALRSVEVIVAAVTVENQSAAADFMLGQIDMTKDDKKALKIDSVLSAMMPLLPYSGCRITQQKGPLAGALGPVVRLRQRADPTKMMVCGLTSRHVAVGPLLDTRRSYDVTKNGRDTLDAVMMTADAVDTNCEEKLADCEDKMLLVVSKMRHRLRNDLTGQDEDAAESLLSHQAAIPYIQKLNNAMRDTRATAPQARTLGRVMYTPEFALGRHRNLRDWALFELPKSQKGDFTSVYIDDAAQLKATKWARFVTPTTAGTPTGHDNKAEWEPIFKLSPELMLRLHGRGIPINPPYKTSSAPSTHPSSSPSSKYPYFLVAKRGPMTGLTCGVVNELGSVNRVPFSTDDSYISTHMVILPIADTNRFSAKGDSGAAIFDAQGCVVGIIDAGLSLSKPDSRWQPPTTPIRPERKENVPPGVAPSSSPSPSRRMPQRQRQPESGPGTDPSRSATTGTLPSIQANDSNNMDITFATPIQWLLEDIRSFTGCDAEIV